MDLQKDERERQRLLAVRLIETMEPKLAVILGKWTSDHYLIEDVMLDTWELMLKHMDVLEDHPNPEGWIVKTAKYTMWKELRKQKARQEREKDILMALDGYARDMMEQDEQFFDAYRKILSDEEIRLLKLIYVYGVDHKTAAGYLGIKPAACRKRVERIRRKIEKFYLDRTEE